MEAHVVTDEELATWKPRLEQLARAFRNQAEEDDLVQVGWIFVWQSLSRGAHPTDEMIRARMSNWCRTLRRQESGRSERLPEDEVR